MTPLTPLALFALVATAPAATLTVTGYCPCAICCGAMGGSGLTASGVKAQQGVTVAASRSIPFGARVLIAGRTFIVQDRPAARFDDRLDLFFDKHADALRFGKRTVRVTILAAPSPSRTSRAVATGASSRGTGAAISLKNNTRRKA